MAPIASDTFDVESGVQQRTLNIGQGQSKRFAMCGALVAVTVVSAMVGYLAAAGLDHNAASKLDRATGKAFHASTMVSSVSNAHHGSRISAPVVMKKDKKSKFIDILLTEDVEKLGEAGDVVKVKHVYAENIVIPKHGGIVATPEMVSKAETDRKEKAATKAAEEKAKADAAQADLDAAKKQAEDFLAVFGDKDGKQALVISRKANPDGLLFGAVNAGDILDEIKKTLPDTSIDKKIITMPDIKSAGESSVTFTFHKDVVVTLKLVVEVSKVKDKASPFE